MRFVLLPGQRYDTVGVPALIEGIGFACLIADKAFDTHAIVAELARRGAAVVIPQRRNRLVARPFDPNTYKWRHLIENFFCKLKEFKRVALRSDKTDQSFTAVVYLAAAVVNSR